MPVRRAATKQPGSPKARSKRRATRRQADPWDPDAAGSDAVYATDPKHADDTSRVSAAGQIAYWAEVSADDNGMLGGYTKVSKVDLQFTRNFLRKLPKSSDGDKHRGSNGNGAAQPQNGDANAKGGGKQKYEYRCCLEPGAGIGRVTLNLLSAICETIDIIEPQAKFTAKLTTPDCPVVPSGQLQRVYNVPLQDWAEDTPPSWTNETAPPIEHLQADASKAPQYDLIFNQWCLTYLSASVLKAYLYTLKTLLAPGGWIIVKENLSTLPEGQDMYWDEDSSVTRSDESWRRSFDDAGLTIVLTEEQTGWPENLLPVRIYALKPKGWDVADGED
jgi:protein N-terminal methyltransferase